jgi:hypothetical protein
MIDIFPSVNLNTKIAISRVFTAALIISYFVLRVLVKQTDLSECVDIVALTIIFRTFNLRAIISV